MDQKETVGNTLRQNRDEEHRGLENSTEIVAYQRLHGAQVADTMWSLIGSKAGA